MRCAYVIGSNGPPSFGAVKRLDYAEADAERVAASLGGELCGFSVERPSPKMRPKDIVEAIEAICESCGPDDAFLLYFSGHGVLDAKGNLLLLWNQSDPEAILTSTIAMSKIMIAIEACRANNKLLVLDCCHAGAVVNMAGFKGASEIALSDRIVPPENYAIIMASGKLDRAREFASRRAGFLTDNFCKGLGESFSRADRDGDQRISVSDISWWLASCAEAHNNAYPKHTVPYPSVFGKTRGDFYLTLGLDEWIPPQLDWPNQTTMVVLPALLQDDERYAICVSKHLVTNAQYAAFIAQSGRKPPSGQDFIFTPGRSRDAVGGVVGHWEGPFLPWEDERFNHPGKPVVCVSLHEAQVYARWLAEQVKEYVFLPSVKLWDFAAFGTPYPSRDPRTWLRTTKSRWDKAESPCEVRGPADAERINQHGLTDMIGNVWEWCDAYGRRVALRARESECAVRGGGFLDDLTEIEPFLSGSELTDGEATRHTDLGFRIAGLVPIDQLNEATRRRLGAAPRLSGLEFD